jgi:hypothetical protein
LTEAAVSFAGNLPDDPELRHTEAGIARAMFRVAVSGRREQEASFFLMAALTVGRPMRGSGNERPRCNQSPSLAHEPAAMHPYQLSRTLRDHDGARGIKYHHGSLYMVVQQLAKAGFIAAQETSRTSQRPNGPCTPSPTPATANCWALTWSPGHPALGAPRPEHRPGDWLAPTVVRLHGAPAKPANAHESQESGSRRCWREGNVERLSA